MNIVLDCERMKYPHTGLNTFCAQLSQAMTHTVKKDDLLSFFVAKCDKGFMGEQHKYIEQHFWFKKLPLFYLSNTDIWHTTYQLSPYTGGGKLTKKLITIHDLNFLYEKTRKTKIKQYLKKHQKYIDRVEHIVAISEYVKQDILNHLDVKGKSVSVIHNGFEVIEYPDYNNPSYFPQKPFIFCIGVLNPKKNFHVLTSLLKNNDYELLIAGKHENGDYKNKIETTAKLHGVSKRVKILEPISQKDKYWYLKNCLAFAFPSIAEGFGLPVLEAMHFGKPVFLSNRTSLPEIGGKRAYYFENFDSEHMQDIFSKGMDDYVTNHRAKDIISHSQQFSWQKSAQEYYKLYHSLTMQ